MLTHTSTLYARKPLTVHWYEEQISICLHVIDDHNEILPIMSILRSYQAYAGTIPLQSYISMTTSYRSLIKISMIHILMNIPLPQALHHYTPPIRHSEWWCPGQYVS